MNNIIKSLADAVVINLFLIKLMGIIACIIMMCSNTHAQTNVMVKQDLIKTTTLAELHLPAGLDCVLVPTKGTRILVVQNIKVQHPTKESAVARYVETNGSCDLLPTADFIHNRLNFQTKKGKHLVIDGKIAQVKPSYTIYVPEHMVIRKG